MDSLLGLHDLYLQEFKKVFIVSSGDDNRTLVHGDPIIIDAFMMKWKMLIQTKHNISLPAYLTTDFFSIIDLYAIARIATF